MPTDTQIKTSVVSRDGTEIAYWTSGDGPAVEARDRELALVGAGNGHGALPAAAAGPGEMIATGAPAAAVPAERPTRMSLVYVWILLFGFVGTQLAWTLRPFFGDPDSPFALFREISGTFYSNILHTIGTVVG